MWEKLKLLHHVNALSILFLFASGFLMFFPALRGDLAEIRVTMKLMHIVIGIASVAILIFYIPLFKSHWMTIRKQQEKKINLLLILVLILSWLISGLLLTFHKSVPVSIVQSALFVHNLSTWIGLPIIVYHSITRLRSVRMWMRKQLKEQSGGRKLGDFSRRGFFRYSIGTLVVLVIGPSLYKWVKQLTDDGGSALSEIAKKSKNQLTPLPTPAKASSPPIGGGYQGNFRVYTVTETPIFTNENFGFVIDGLVKQPLKFTWEQFIALKRTVQVSDFYCVTGWTVRNVTYEGVLLKDLLAMAKLDPRATHIKFYSGDGVYTDALSLDQAQMGDCMVALLMDGEPIPSDYGGPVRLIVPKMYAYKAVKWLVRIEAIDQPHQGYWQVRGYDTDAWVGKG